MIKFYHGIITAKRMSQISRRQLLAHLQKTRNPQKLIYAEINLAKINILKVVWLEGVVKSSLVIPTDIGFWQNNCHKNVFDFSREKCFYA